MRIRIRNTSSCELKAEVHIIYKVGSVFSESCIDANLPYGTPPDEILIILTEAGRDRQ